MSSPFNTGWVASLEPNFISFPAIYTCLDSIFTLSFESKPTDFCPLINTLSDLAFKTILLELIIICGELNEAGVIGGVVYEIKFSLAKLNGIFWVEDNQIEDKSLFAFSVIGIHPSTVEFFG